MSNEENRPHILAKYSAENNEFRRRAKKHVNSIDPVNLRKDRIKFGTEREILSDIIKKIQSLNNQKPLNEADRQRIDIETQQYYTIASLKGLMGLYDGLALLSDMSSVDLVEEDKKTKKEYSVRASLAEIMFDILAALDELITVNRKQNRMMVEMGKKQGWYWKDRIGPDEEPEDSVKDGQTLDSPAPVGVPLDEIEAQSKVTPEQVEKALRGE